MDLNNSAFYISLDFEHFWGRDSGYEYDKGDIDRYGLVHEVVPRLLALFEKYEIAATWATVGLLAIENLEELEHYRPKIVADDQYKYANNYIRFKNIIKNNDHGNWVYGDQLIRQIIASPNQELASHTFAHIFCNEQGITNEIVKADILASQNLFRSKYEVEIESLVFPYNQIPDLEEMELDIKFIRSDNSHSVYRNNNINSYRRLHKRAIRFIDRYWNVTGKNTVRLNQYNKYILVPESRFLPPSIGAKMGKKIENRIKLEISEAAESCQSYHLWWHPHNFTVNMDECFKSLEEILKHYMEVSNKYDFPSLSMNKGERY